MKIQVEIDTYDKSLRRDGKCTLANASNNMIRFDIDGNSINFDIDELKKAVNLVMSGSN